MYNTLLYIGIAFLLSGFVLFVIAVNMNIYYDRKLYKLHQREQREKLRSSDDLDPNYWGSKDISANYHYEDYDFNNAEVSKS